MQFQNMPTHVKLDIILYLFAFSALELLRNNSNNQLKNNNKGSKKINLV